MTPEERAAETAEKFLARMGEKHPSRSGLIHFNRDDWQRMLKLMAFLRELEQQ